MDLDGRPRHRRVRAWFGNHVIADYVAPADVAERYAAATQRRFTGLRVTVDDELSGNERPMPSQQLWEVAPL